MGGRDRRSAAFSWATRHRISPLPRGVSPNSERSSSRLRDVIDFHCHLDLYSEPGAVLESVIERECFVLAVTTTPLAWEGTDRLVGGASRVRLAAGLHPELVASRYHEVDRLRELVAETPYIGEIGLDGSRPHRSSLPLQCEVLHEVLSACESAGGRIMTIHSRGAASLVLDHVETHGQAGVPVLHWFTGSQAELQRAIRLGCWFSVGPAMLRSESGRRLASSMPADRVLTETDGPFARRGSAPLMPWHVVEAEASLAELWSVSRADIKERLASNLRTLVRRAPAFERRQTSGASADGKRSRGQPKP